MNIYRSIQKLYEEEPRLTGLPESMRSDSARQALRSAPHGGETPPCLAFAFDHIEQDGESWHCRCRIELYSADALLSVQEVPALLALETSMVSELAEKDAELFGLAPHSWSFADTDLYRPLHALPLIRGLRHSRREFLRKVIELHLPERKPEVSDADFFDAFDLSGTYALCLGIAEQYLGGNLVQGAEFRFFERDDEEIEAFFKELTLSYAFEEDDDWPEGLTPAEIMVSIVSFYNAFMKYRELIFARRELDRIRYILENCSALAP